MPLSNTQITDEELLKKLNDSSLSDKIKKGYTEVISQMDDEEREGLLIILNKTAEAENEFEQEKLERLAKMNDELNEYLSNVSRTESKNVRNEFEKLANEEDKEKMNELETEINSL